MAELIICEKPRAAEKIAYALADKAPKKISENKVPYYKLKHNKKDIIVACAVGHLYGVGQKKGRSMDFPVFDVAWQPVSKLNKSAKFSAKYLSLLKKLSKEADEFTVATDYDIEGEVIGLNVIRLACKQKDANRMKFSTLTKPDLVKAYESKSKHIDWGQANAGETRHMLDWFYGINASRALTSSIKSTGKFKLMSTGRVQGPALKIVVDKEKEIKAFKPEPFWQIQLDSYDPKEKENMIESWHEQDKFWKKDIAQKTYDNVKKEKKAEVKKVQKRSFSQAPPKPFDLTSLQMESYRCNRITPKRTLAIAQELYTSGFISYPRTSSQKLPKEIGYKKIIKQLSKQKQFKEAADILLAKKTLRPNEGKKTDPAHPAIYPTGIVPHNLGKEEQKVYTLIARRFLATFGDPAKRQTMNITIQCNKEKFIAKGTTTKEKGWHTLYAEFNPAKEDELPDLKEGQVLDIKKTTLHSKETQPPKRYTEASIIRELEKRNLGTKATRAQIVDTLFQRNYIEGKQIQATELGIRTEDVLEKYSPTITDEKLTRTFEEDMERIREGKEKEEKVLDSSKIVITKIIADFKKNEKQIGKELLSAQKETQNEQNLLGPCPVCKKGNLVMRYGKYGKFAACDKYPECKTTLSLPGNALIKPAKKICESCGYPIVQVIKKGKKPQEHCINPECPLKSGDSKEMQKEIKEIEEGDIEKKCPKCGKPMKLRTSIYGKFWGCTGYPKCKTIDPLKEAVKKEDFKKK